MVYRLRDRPDDGKVSEIVRALGVSGLVAGVLLARGVTGAEMAQGFLRPDLGGLEDPQRLPDIAKATERIRKAVESSEKVLVFGDYDVDGITATAIMVDYLRSLGLESSYFLPSRSNEGYGLTMKAIGCMPLDGVGLIITVDCGTSSLDEVRLLKGMGIDTIVTDHHECGDALPEAVAVVNPHRADSGYGFRNLVGAGVSLKAVMAINEALGARMDLEWYVMLAAIGTLADYEALVGENRAIVRVGLEYANSKPRAEIDAIMEAGRTKYPLSAKKMSYHIIPRLNALGRIGDPNRAVEFLLSKEAATLREIAFLMDKANSERKAIEARQFAEAEAYVEGRGMGSDGIIMVVGEGWHNGVSGIVAKKVAAKYGRPCFVIAVNDSMGKASGRSVGEFDLFAAMRRFEGLFESYGGHMKAVGFTIREGGIPTLLERMRGVGFEGYGSCEEELTVDLEVSPDDVTLENAVGLKALEPSGNGSEEPVFILRRCEVAQSSLVGNGNHLLLRLYADGRIFRAIGFNMPECLRRCRQGSVIDVIFCLDVDDYGESDRALLRICGIP